MKKIARPIILLLLLLPSIEIAIAQENNQATPPKKEKSDTLELGKSYANLRPEQKPLVDDFIRRYNATTGSNLVPQMAYDNGRLSVRTTFDAVTHALLNAKMTDANGKSLGRAIDLVESVDEVFGEESGVGGESRRVRQCVRLRAREPSPDVCCCM